MKGWQAKLKDCLCLNFAIEAGEIKRLLPRGTEADYRRFRGKKHAFFSLFFFNCSSLRHSSIGWPSLSFPAVLLQFYVRDASDNPAVYLKRIFASGFTGFLFRWVLNLPVNKLNFSYPTRANPGGTFRWLVEDGGVGNVLCKIKSHSGINGYLGEMFDTPRMLKDFIFQRAYCYYGAGVDGVYRSNPGTYFEELYPVVIKDWELGFIASDLERHSFPEARSSCFFLPELQLDLKNSEFVDTVQLTGGEV